MFAWLEEEISRIRTPKFHLIEGPASSELREAVEASDLPLPPSYKSFVVRFGNARLYRRSSYWLVQIYAGPREAETPGGEGLVNFGRTQTSLAYFKVDFLEPGGESPVFEWFGQGGFRQTANGFEEWLQAKCRAARRRFKKGEWEAIESGPAPFTDQERQRVEDRKHFRWRPVGIAPNGALRFEIHNGSTSTLPYLSVGVRGVLRPPNSGPLEGGAFLPVASILPGETGTVDFDCYKKYISAETTEVFDLPDPGPEDREQYWEFR
jgi:hypothetical protein